MPGAIISQLLFLMLSAVVCYVFLQLFIYFTFSAQLSCFASHFITVTFFSSFLFLFLVLSAPHKIFTISLLSLSFLVDSLLVESSHR